MTRRRGPRESAARSNAGRCGDWSPPSQSWPWPKMAGPLCHGHGQRAHRPASPQTSSTTSPPPERHTRHRPAAAVSATPCARDQPPGHAPRLPISPRGPEQPRRCPPARASTAPPRAQSPVATRGYLRFGAKTCFEFPTFCSASAGWAPSRPTEGQSPRSDAGRAPVACEHWSARDR